MKLWVFAVAVAAVAATFGGRLVLGQHGLQFGRTTTALAGSAADPALLTMAGLPSEKTAQAVLTSSLGRHHHDWLEVPAGSATIRTFVVYPDRARAAPVVLVTAKNQGMSDWMRAVADQVAVEGFIGVVPDVLSGAGPSGGGSESFPTTQAATSALGALGQREIRRRTDAIRAYAVKIPGSNGNTVTLGFDFAGTARIEVELDRPNAPRRVASFDLGEHAWHNALAFISQADARPVNELGQEPAGERAGRGGRGGRGERGGCSGNMREKCQGLPANFLMAATTVAHSSRKGDWIDVPMGAARIRTWITYPQTNAKAPVIVVIQPGPGMDMGEPPTPGGGANWLRAIADELASEGFIALVPDFTSGLGPKGGNFDSFKYPDEVAQALGRRNRAEQVNLMRTVRDYGLKLPQANGKSATIGFCFGGGMSWIAAAELAGLNAAVVFYGGPPDEATMAKITAPVVAFFGENDLGLAPQIAPATANMRRLGKSFDVHVYPRATHVFLYRQDLGENFAATQDAWPKALAFLKQHTKG